MTKLLKGAMHNACWGYADFMKPRLQANVMKLRKILRPRWCVGRDNLGILGDWANRRHGAEA
jgi:hypothetical protein